MSIDMKIFLLILAMVGFFVAEVATLCYKKALSLWRIIYAFMYGFTIQGIVFLIAITNSSLLIAFWRIVLFVAIVISIITVSYGIVISLYKNYLIHMRIAVFCATPLLSCFIIMFIGTTAANLGIYIPTLVMYTVSFILWGVISGLTVSKYESFTQLT